MPETAQLNSLKEAQMLWSILAAYGAISLGIGIIFTTYRFIKHRHKIPNSKKGVTAAREKVLAKDIAAGHVQKEEYGERVVYHGNDMVGKATLASLETVDRLMSNNKPVFLVLLALVGVLDTAILWPRKIYKWAFSPPPVQTK